MVMIRGVIFDFDGTLVEQHIDFPRAHAEIISLARRLDISLPRPARPLLELPLAQMAEQVPLTLLDVRRVGQDWRFTAIPRP